MRGRCIFVSHDRYFVNKFATRIWELENGHIRDYPCGYEKYRSIKEKEAIAVPVPEKPKKEHKEKPKTSGSKMIEKKVRALEREIEKQEALSAELDGEDRSGRLGLSGAGAADRGKAAGGGYACQN